MCFFYLPSFKRVLFYTYFKKFTKIWLEIDMLDAECVQQRKGRKLSKSMPGAWLQHKNSKCLKKKGKNNIDHVRRKRMQIFIKLKLSCLLTWPVYLKCWYYYMYILHRIRIYRCVYACIIARDNIHRCRRIKGRAFRGQAKLGTQGGLQNHGPGHWFFFLIKTTLVKATKTVDVFML